MARSIPELSESLISMIMRTRGVTREQAIEIIGMSPDSDTASLADGLDGAPQDDITPEPVAGEASPSRQAMPSDTPLAPPEVMTEADIDYVNSLPQNSPEAMARKRKRWAKSDADMVDFANRLGLPGAAAQLQEFDRQAGLYPTQSSPSSASGYQSDLPPGLDPNHPRWGGGDPARVQQLMDANPGAFFGPGELTPEQEQHKKRLEGNREQYYDQVNNAKTPEGKPVFQRAEGTYGGNEELGVEPYQKYEYTEEARQMREGENAASFMEGPISLKDRQLARMLLNGRADRIARQTGRNRAEVRNELMNSGSFYRDPASGRLMLRSGDDTRDFTRQQQIDDLDLRREKVRQRGEMGLLPSQSAISNNVVNARRILGDPDATDEERLAAKYWLSPQSFMVDYAAAQNPSQSSSAEELIKMQIAQQAAQQQAREGDPVGAGISDAKESKFSKQAMDWIEDEAAAFDEDWFGFTRESERRFAEYLKETYGFTQDQAEEAARRGANSRRWFWDKRGGGQDPGPDFGDSGGGGF